MPEMTATSSNRSASRRRLGAHERERRVVDEVHHDIPPGRSTRSTSSTNSRRGEVPRDGEAAEGIAHDEVESVVGQRLDRPARVADDDGDRDRAA